MRKALILAVAVLSACQTPVGTAGSAGAATPAPVDPTNATYTLEKRSFTLKDGSFEDANPTSRALVKLSDKRAAGELNADGKADAAVVVSLNSGGSGVFSYVVALIGSGDGKGTATNAIMLGDRVGVDAVRIDAGGKIVVEMLDRKPGEPFSTAPSVKVTRTFQLANGTLSEVK